MYLIWFFFLFIFGFMMMLISLFFLYNNNYMIMDYELLTVNSSMISLTLIFDFISCIFSSCVFFISSMVVMYSYSYMSGDLYKNRFLYILLMFIFSMFMLIMSPNMISILIGWDGLGLVSYCLVIYYQNVNSYNAGMLTILMNRIGDVCILISIFWMFGFGSWGFYNIYFFNNWLFYLFFLIILASFTKSAQIPFSSWLPAAMAAPTPVSSLVHSSTLVTAGVYLLIRFSDLLLQYDCWFFVFISMMTMFMSGLSANFEFDLKKIIALSTLSQLGLMMMILFLGFSNISFFHLLVHAFFKALLFLCAGLIIHVMNNSQDIRHMGGLYNIIPFTVSCFLISNFSLCGFPFLSGFYSKDLIIEMFMFCSNNIFYYLILYMSLGLTVSYTFRLIYFILLINPMFNVYLYFNENYLMNISMVFLCFMSVVFGSSMFWLMFNYPCFLFLNMFSKLFSLFMILLGLMFGLEVSKFNFFFNSITYNNYFFVNFLSGMWFMPKLSTVMFSKIMWKTIPLIYNNVDSGWGEFYMSKYLYMYVISLSKMKNPYYMNNIKLYLMSFFILLLYFIF